MNELVVRQGNSLVISDSTKELIQASVSYNTLNAYGWALQRTDEWLSAVNDKRELNDAVPAEYLTDLHESGKSPATIAQVVAAAKWQSANVKLQVFGAATARTLAGICRNGGDRVRGQYHGSE